MGTAVERKKEIRKKRNKLSRAFRLKNLKRIADKNKAFCKMAERNMIQACILSIACIIFGIIFISLTKISSVTKIVENSITGAGSLITFFTSIKTFMSPPPDDDSTSIKFSDINDEMVELSLETTDEDDVRNTERTIELWCTYLRIMKTVYTVFIMFSSLLLIIFIILDFTLKDVKLVSVNIALIVFGGISLSVALINVYLLKLFTFTGEGGKDIERLINGINIYIRRNSARDLDQLMTVVLLNNDKDLPPKKPRDITDKFSKEKSELIELTKYITRDLELPSVKDKISRWIWRLSILLERLFNIDKNSIVKSSKSDEPTLKEKLEELVKMKTDSKSIINCETAISKFVFDVLKEANQKIQESDASKSKSHMEKLIMKLSLKELIEVATVINSKFPYNSATYAVDNDILNELYLTIKELFDMLFNIKIDDNEISNAKNIEKELPRMLNEINKKKYGEKTMITKDDLLETFNIFKEISQTISITGKESTHETKDEYTYNFLYDKILDVIDEIEHKGIKFQPKSCYIDLGKHFGRRLFNHIIPDPKKHMPYKEANQKLIRSYYRLGGLLYSDNDGDNAPNRVTDLRIRKAQNIYKLFNKLPPKDLDHPINRIKRIGTRYAVTIFALSSEDVEYLIDAIDDHRAKKPEEIVKPEGQAVEENGKLEEQAVEENDKFDDHYPIEIDRKD